MKIFALTLMLLGSLSSRLGLICQETHSNDTETPDSSRQITDIAEDTTGIPQSKDNLKEVLNLDYVMGRFDPATRPDFIMIDSQYADKKGMFLRKDAYEAFLKMYTAAMTEGIRLRIVSATRNFDAQKTIWEGKWTGARLVDGGENLSITTPDPKQRAMKILRFSSMPGSSRHHWGTDIDLNNLENNWFESGEGLRIYEWLKRNADRYGFCQPYTAGRPFGYNEEKWHWSYIPVASALTRFANQNLKNEMIQGFLGSETAPMIDIVHRYVLGINEECNRQP